MVSLASGQPIIEPSVYVVEGDVDDESDDQHDARLLNGSHDVDVEGLSSVGFDSE